MNAKVKNVTFSLPIDVIEKLKIYANNNYINSMNSGVKEAIEDYIKKIEKQKLAKEMIEASKDIMFMKDLEDSMQAFEFSDNEMELNEDW
jgi:predicted DNA-binding protein